MVTHHFVSSQHKLELMFQIFFCVIRICGLAWGIICSSEYFSEILSFVVFYCCSIMRLNSCLGLSFFSSSSKYCVLWDINMALETTQEIQLEISLASLCCK